jgi:uroporphyrinogen-III synthase
MQSLKGLRVLITRPEPQATDLAKLIAAEGGESVVFPSITIAAMPAAAIAECVQQISVQDMAIFISPNAVKYGFSALNPVQQQQLKTMNVFAVGEGTAKALQQLGCQRVIFPKHEASSEGVLALPELSQVGGKTVWLFRGSQGRELLAEELRQRGAKVNYIACYQRKLPNIDRDKLIAACRQGLDVVIVTSIEGLQNLLQLLGEHKSLLTPIPITVLNTRMQAAAEALGLSKTYLVPGAANAQLLHFLKMLTKS